MNLFRKNSLWLLCLVVVIGVSYWLFQLNGIIVILGIVILLFLPFYLTIRNFDLEDDEKIFFSLFAGVGIFPLLTYILFYVLKSLRLSIAATFAMVTTAGIIITYMKKKRGNKN